MSEDTQVEDEVETGTIDTLSFNYLVQEAFVSRACGFVANFTELDTTRQVFTTDWIKGIILVESAVTNSNEIHVQILH